MNTNYGAQLHFRAAFELQPEPRANCEWVDLVRDIRDWLIPRVREGKGLHGGWLFEGGGWKHPENSRIGIRVETAHGNGTSSAPQFWALSYQHPCNEIGARQWRTDIGLTAQTNGAYHVHLTTSFWLLSGFIGDEPSAPLPTSPTIVRSLMGLPGWRAFAGSEPLFSRPTTLEVGKGDRFFSRLTDRSRQCPIVYLARDRATAEFCLDPAHVARLLAGMAAVYAAENSDCDEELTIFLPEDLRCANGMVRVYQPGVNVDSPTNWRRHRFFSRGYILDRGIEHSEAVIVRGLARRPVFLPTDAVTDVEDVAARSRELRIAALRSKAETAADKEELLRVSDEVIRDLDVKVKELQTRVGSLEAEVEERDDRLAYLEHASRDSELRARKAETKSQKLTDVLAQLQRLPATLIDAVTAIEKLHSDKIAFTPKARQSASESEFDDIPEAWGCLWAVATILHDLYFAGDGSSVEIDRVFKEKSGFELAFTEGAQTKKDSKLMRLRKDRWHGVEVDIAPHVKLDKGRKFFRVHYYVAKENELIVVGWCGDHLDTSGTRYRK